MSKVYESITPAIQTWIGEQKIFFVGTAPLAADGHINCSPKGGDSFRILDEHTVAYQDYTGSGIETLSHVQENGRMVLMFVGFEGPPNIVRLHGKAQVHIIGSPEFETLQEHFSPNPGVRAIFLVQVDRVSDSCGLSVPYMDYRGPREYLDKWATKQGPEGLQEYRGRKNQRSIDGLPAWQDQAAACTDQG